jgi:hypothetical protein
MHPPQLPPQGMPPQQFAPAPAPQPPVDKTIQGLLHSYEPRQSGWYRFLIYEQGKQYPTKVDTKKPELIQEAGALLGQNVSANIREQPSDSINPHNGKPYTNRYLNAIAPAGFAPGVQPSPQAQQSQQTFGSAPPAHPVPTHSEPVQQFQPGIAGFEKDLNIMRQTAAKVVAMSVSILPPEQRDAKGMVEACEAWLGYFVHGPLRFGVTPFDQPRQAQVQDSPLHGVVGPHGVNPAVQPQPGYSTPQPGPPQGSEQTDIFGAPYDGDPGPQDGQYESLGQ